MFGLFCFVLAVLASPFKSKTRLEAENAVLRHQLIVLRRKVQGRARLTNSDRWFFIQLYRWFPSILQVVTIVQPEGPHYLIRDRDRIYGAAVVTRRLSVMGIRDKPTAPPSPWQNGFAERLIGSIRRECVDHIVVLSETHLRQILRSYARYYNGIRTHRSLDKDAPVSRPIQRIGSINSHAILGGLHHHYVRAWVFGTHNDHLIVHNADFEIGVGWQGDVGK